MTLAFIPCSVLLQCGLQCALPLTGDCLDLPGREGGGLRPVEGRPPPSHQLPGATPAKLTSAARTLREQG